jgi:hypothetical protein
MVECGLPKAETRVRFPSPAPFSFNNLHGCAGKVQEKCRRTRCFSNYFSLKMAGNFCVWQNRRRQNSCCWIFYFSYSKRISAAPCGRPGGEGRNRTRPTSTNHSKSTAYGIAYVLTIRRLCFMSRITLTDSILFNLTLT